MEEGDLDDLDDDEVADQVAKIHQRRMLDQDKREMRVLKEKYLEDGELHSEHARARKFRWKGIGN